MVTQIDEQEARRELRNLSSEASNPANYAAARRARGWLFGWRTDRGSAPMGTRAWVVADNGRGRMLDLRDRADEVIEALLAEYTPTNG
ncbi:hypothetical protein [Cryobacterium aureum]|uniref:hypothetical protein n=1 Tax=Cryobacterium aureum TaxID=995037 RepID=UPI000CF44BE6|nr:hypothetical protein [Cryobacterium aureum]